MTALLIYMLKSALVLALLTLTYRMTLRRETFHRFNRAILLAIAAVSFIVPAVSLSTASPSAVNMAISHAETWLQVPATVTAHPAKGEGSPSSYLPLLIASLYLLGLVATLLRYALQYIGLMRLFRRSRRVTQLNGLSIHLNDALPAPVSWMNYIFLSPDDYRKHADYLLRHEVAHARQRHTLDIIAGQAVTALQWFNPAAHLWMNDLRAVHEFLADRAASPPGYAGEAYQMLLIQKAVTRRTGLAAAHSFNACPLKRRIIMMYHNPSSRRAMLKGLFLLPAALLAIGAFAHPRSEAPARPMADPASPAVSQPASVADGSTVPSLSSTMEDGNNTIKLLKELNKHLVYPESAKKQKVEGVVVAKFTTDKDGNLKNVVIEKSLNPDCDKAVINAIKKISNTSLKSMVKGNATTTYSLPVRFKIQ